MKKIRQITAGSCGRLVLTGAVTLALAAAAGCGSSSGSGSTAASSAQAGSSSSADSSSLADGSTLSDDSSLTDDSSGDSSADETSAAVEKSAEVKVADYDPSKYVTLSDYKKMTIDILSSEVTDDDVESEISSELEDAAKQTDVTDGAKTGDYLNIDVTATVDGKKAEDLSSTDYDICLGDETLGADVDKALTGAKKGDTKSVKVTLDSSYGDDYNGKTAEYEIKVNNVYSYVTPELTEDYVKENTDYDSIDAYRKGVRKTLEEQNTNYNRTEAGTRALTEIVENSTFNGYPQDLYDSIYQDYDYLYTRYAQGMFGIERSELISDDDLKTEVENAVNQALVVQAIADQEKISVSDNEYQKYLEDNYMNSGYSSAKEFQEDSYETALRREILQNKVEDWLLDNNTLNEMTQDEYDKKYGSSSDSLSDSDSLSGDSPSDGDSLSDGSTLSDGSSLSDGDSLSDGSSLSDGETLGASASVTTEQ